MPRAFSDGPGLCRNYRSSAQAVIWQSEKRRAHCRIGRVPEKPYGKGASGALPVLSNGRYTRLRPEAHSKSSEV